MRKLKKQSRKLFEKDGSTVLASSTKKPVQEKKLETKRGQTKSKRRENVEITQRKRSEQHGENVEITQRKHRENVEINRQERRDKPGENVEITQRKRSEQHGENVEIKSVLKNTNPTLLVGTQRRVFSYLINLSQNYASLTTPPLTLESMSSATSLSSSQIHTATKELRKKGCIVISSRKDGRGGWVSYSINSDAYEEWERLINKQIRRENVEITQRKRSEQPGDKHRDNSPSSSSNTNSLKITTSTSLPENWALIQTPENVKQLRFGEAQIKQLYKKGDFEAEEIQEYLEHFSYELEIGGFKNSYKGPLSVFMGTLIKGNPFLSDAYLIEEKRKMEKSLSLLKEARELKSQIKKEELLLEFEKYKKSLSQEEIDKLVPPNSLAKSGSEIQLSIMKKKWEEGLL